MTITGVLNKLRRRLGDTDSNNYVFTDSELKGYIGDSIPRVKNYLSSSLEYDEKNQTLSREVSSEEADLLALQAHILVTIRIKSSADRDNFSIRKGRLRIDNTKQSSDHAETLSRLEKEKRELIWEMCCSNLQGVRVE